MATSDCAKRKIKYLNPFFKGCSVFMSLQGLTRELQLNFLQLKKELEDVVLKVFVYLSLFVFSFAIVIVINMVLGSQ